MATVIVDTFGDFCTAGAHFTREAEKWGWRHGQALFNLLDRVRPDLAGLLRDSDFDPFYQNDRLPDFYDFLSRHWNDGDYDGEPSGPNGQTY